MIKHTVTQHVVTKPKYHMAKHLQCAEIEQCTQDVEIAVKRGGRLTKVIVRVNVIRPVCSLLFGNNHPLYVRLIAGLVVAASGVVLAKYVGHSHNEIVAYIGDGVGYGLHALGLTPFIEHVAHTFED